MKKGEVYEGIIEQVDFPNKGRVMVDGQPVIVKNGMPGQRVRFMINKIFIIDIYSLIPVIKSPYQLKARLFKSER